jgi:alpha,alpha-trehalase
MTRPDASIDRLRRFIRDHWQLTIRSGKSDVDHVQSLPYRHSVPCFNGHFIAMYYWDTYFTNLGLLADGLVDVARENCDNMLFLIGRYGFVPNSTFVSDDNRSQPPYLVHMVEDVYRATGDRTWLTQALPGLEREQTFWTEQRAACHGLARHGNSATPEYLDGFYRGALADRLGAGDVSPALRLEIASQYLAEAETGWDFNPRFAGRCLDHAPVDLNALLFGREVLLAGLHRELRDEERAETWQTRAKARREAMQALWCNEVGFFFDFDCVNQCRSPVFSLAGYMPLFSGLATPEQAERAALCLERFRGPHGYAVCPRDARSLVELRFSRPLQWDYPNQWPPLAYVTAVGLLRYGHREAAQRVARCYCDLLLANFENTEQLWEKFDVETGGPAGGEYEAQPMLGWSAGVFIALTDLAYG